MKTDCSKKSFEFQSLSSRKILGAFDGGHITSDAGGLLLREAESRTNIIKQFAACFTDHRDPEKIEHTVYELVAQRVYGLALGYEDLNDHDDLRVDPLLGLLAGKADPTGADRARERDRGKALAGKSTLNRLELTPSDADASARYKKIVLNEDLMNLFFVELFLQSRRGGTPPKRIVLDLDATTPWRGCMAIRRAVFFTAITAITVICRSTFSAAMRCYARVCARRTSTLRAARSMSLNGSWTAFGRRGPM